MAYKVTDGTMHGVRIFIESFHDFERLWDGMYILLIYYLQEHIEDGVDNEISSDFLKDLDNLMELVWTLHELAKKE